MKRTGTKGSRYTAADIGRTVTYRRNGRLYTAEVGPSGKLIRRTAVN